MDSDKKSLTNSVLIIILLLSQVVLSITIVVKLNRIDRRIISAQSNSSQIAPLAVPDYVENVSDDDDPVRGSEQALVTIVEFADYECHACAEAENALRTILSEYDGKVRLVYRDFTNPRVDSPAFKAAEAAHCAGDQGQYWEMHDLLYANQTQVEPHNLTGYAVQLNLDVSLFNDCLESAKYADEILHDIEDGEEYQVIGTPTFFVNGYRVMGGSREQLKQRIDFVLSNEDK